MMFMRQGYPAESRIEAAGFSISKAKVLAVRCGSCLKFQIRDWPAKPLKLQKAIHQQKFDNQPEKQVTNQQLLKPSSLPRHYPRLTRHGRAGVRSKSIPWNRSSSAS
jgi:hypothetical protein